MAPQKKNSGRTLDVSVAPKKIYKPTDFSGAQSRCFLCGTKIDFERGGHATLRNGDNLFTAKVCAPCWDAARESHETGELLQRRIASVSERLAYGEPVHFDGIVLPGIWGGLR